MLLLGLSRLSGLLGLFRLFSFSGQATERTR